MNLPEPAIGNLQVTCPGHVLVGFRNRLDLKRSPDANENPKAIQSARDKPVPQ